MTPEELDRWSAEKIRGWKWCEIGKGYVFEDNPVSMYPHWQDEYGKFLCYPEKFNWKPSDPKTGQIWLVVEKMREFGFNFHFEIMGTRNLIRFWKIVRPATQSYSGEVKEGISKDSNACLAILKAAHQALTSS